MGEMPQENEEGLTPQKNNLIWIRLSIKYECTIKKQLYIKNTIAFWLQKDNYFNNLKKYYPNDKIKNNNKIF